MIYPHIVTNGSGAAVVIAPGGGYNDLAYSKEGEDIAAMYNSIGVSAFILKYRVYVHLTLVHAFRELWLTSTLAPRGLVSMVFPSGGRRFKMHSAVRVY